MTCISKLSCISDIIQDFTCKYVTFSSEYYTHTWAHSCTSMVSYGITLMCNYFSDYWFTWVAYELMEKNLFFLIWSWSSHLRNWFYYYISGQSAAGDTFEVEYSFVQVSSILFVMFSISLSVWERAFCPPCMFTSAQRSWITKQRVHTVTLLLT